MVAGLHRFHCSEIIFSSFFAAIIRTNCLSVSLYRMARSWSARFYFTSAQICTEISICQPPRGRSYCCSLQVKFISSLKYSCLDAKRYFICVISTGGIFLHYSNRNRTYKYYVENVVTDILLHAFNRSFI